MQVTIFELGSRIGGLWVYENDSGLSPAHASLHLNSENRVTAYHDFPFPADAPLRTATLSQPGADPASKASGLPQPCCRHRRHAGDAGLLAALADAKSTEYEKVIAAAAKMDKPLGTYETGYGIKFDDKMQNVRASPIIAQWQDGQVRAVFPKEAQVDGGMLADLARK